MAYTQGTVAKGMIRNVAAEATAEVTVEVSRGELMGLCLCIREFWR
jgi:hypothetical protein